MKGHNPQADYIVIDDIWFYKEGKGRYYLGNVTGEDGKNRPVRAHVYVWEKHFGKIPKGFSVHHVDRDPRNNDIRNLRLMESSTHASLHSNEHIEKSRENMNTIVRPYAIAWHKSEAGSEWHKKHYEENTKAIWNTLVTKQCIVCGKEYQVKSSAANHSKYCSQYCKSRSDSKKAYAEANREKIRNYVTSKKEERVCPVCGKTFLAVKYYRTLCCSPECRAKRIGQQKLGKPRHSKQDH